MCTPSEFVEVNRCRNMNLGQPGVLGKMHKQKKNLSAEDLSTADSKKIY